LTLVALFTFAPSIVIATSLTTTDTEDTKVEPFPSSMTRNCESY